MSVTETDRDAPHVVLIDGRLYGSGHTRQHAIRDFRAQIAGALPAMRASMTARAQILPVSDDHASDLAEMRDAAALVWTDTECQDATPACDEDQGIRFLNSYDCPCGETWSNEDDCTCDDRCPTCRTSHSPTRSEDA